MTRQTKASHSKMQAQREKKPDKFAKNQRKEQKAFRDKNFIC